MEESMAAVQNMYYPDCWFNQSRENEIINNPNTTRGVLTWLDPHTELTASCFVSTVKQSQAEMH